MAYQTLEKFKNGTTNQDDMRSKCRTWKRLRQTDRKVKEKDRKGHDQLPVSDEKGRKAHRDRKLNKT